jgi:drug/metabolite transporter (DMT)-like permease
MLFVLLGVAWGIPYLLIKIAVRQLDPAMLVFARMGLAAAILLPVAAARGDLVPVLRRWRPLVPVTAWAVAGFALILAGCYLVAARGTGPSGRGKPGLAGHEGPRSEPGTAVSGRAPVIP